MAVGLIVDFEGGTLEQYDQTVEKMGFSDGNLAPGGVFHWVAKTDDGFRVVDVWESQADFDKFAEETLGPIAAEIGLGEPKVTAYEAHNTLKA